MGKRIFDAVHGFIDLSDDETTLINTLPFQRLRYIRQLGAVYYVYPGGIHTRYEHSLGVLQLATEIFNKVAASSCLNLDDLEYWRGIVRFAALCHDMGHLPFSHVAEHSILGDGGHEIKTGEIIDSDYLAPVWESYAKKHSGRGVAHDVKCIALGPKSSTHNFTPEERILSEIITGDFFGADRIDYLLRDSKCTGVSYGLFDYKQLISMLRVVKDGEKLSLGVEENGIESCEALLIARYFMQKRVYKYANVKSYTFHMKQFISRYYEREAPIKSVNEYLKHTDAEVIAKIHAAYLDPKDPLHTFATPFYEKKHRMQCIELPQNMDVAAAKEIVLKLGILEKNVIFEEHHPSDMHAVENFSVITKGGKINRSNQYMFSKIEKRIIRWIFLPHKEAVLFRRQLANH